MSEFEDYFKTNLENYQIEPRQKVWKNINQKLMIKRFFTPSFRHFNVYYLGAIVGIVASGLFVYNADKREIAINQIAVSKQSERVVVRSCNPKNIIIDLPEKTNSTLEENIDFQAISSYGQNDTCISNNNSNNLEVQLGKSIIPNRIQHQQKSEIIDIRHKKSLDDLASVDGHSEIFMIANRDKDANDYADTLVSIITVEEPQYTLKFANALKQNSQYENYFRPLGDIEKVDSYSLVIYSKTGKVVFSSHDIYEKFDGKQYGKDLSKGVYVYKCAVTFINGKKMNYNGSLTIY